MREGDKKIFLNRPLLVQLINLRFNGYSTFSLAILFGCHRSSIESQLNRYGVWPVATVYRIERIASDVLFRLVPPEPKWEMIDGERITRGKTYKEYLKEAEFKRTQSRIS